jgi:hypothetical protein
MGSAYRLPKEKLCKFPGIVIIHDPENGPNERYQNNDNIHQSNNRLGYIIVQK